MNLLGRLAVARGRDLRLGNLAEQLADLHGDRRLVEEAGSGLTLTHRQAADRVVAWSAGIAAQVQPHDRVVVAAPNSYEFILLCLAAARAGAVPVPVNPRM